jgi:curli biogenesis system outer membrane secretion channel CsgG
MNWHRVIGASLIVLLLCSCKKKPEPVIQSTPSNISGTVPDVGRVDTVPTEAIGYGPSPAAATSDAMKTAILQVNGATIDTGSIQAKYGLDVTDGQDSVSLRATAFAELVAQKSGGAITNFKIKTVEDSSDKGGPYKVTIEANIAHFTPPSDKKIRVVVAPIRFDSSSFVVGSTSFPSQKVSDDISQQVSAALTETGRFSVLDRDSGAAIAQELDMIENGQAPRTENGKLGQAVAADVIWVGHINTLAYNRHSTALITSDRNLVSFSGGWAISQKLVNVATREIMISDSVQGVAPAVAPTTLGAEINAGQVLQNMETNIANQVVTSILSRTFPVTVIDRDGNVVTLSQGGQSVKVGMRYAVASLGKELKDPQTGASLGRSETPCCDVVIDRVTDKLSYGHLDNVKISLDASLPGQLQVEEQIANPHDQAAGRAPLTTTRRDTTKKVAVATDSNNDAPPRPKKEDGKW